LVGPGGVGKTTLAAGIALAMAERGEATLVQTFDPSWRLKDALGISAKAGGHAVRVPKAGGTLWASLLDPRATFDDLIRRHSPDAAASARIFGHRFYRRLAGHLAGLLEYMAIERLHQLATAGRYEQLILDTPPARQAFDFLEAPGRVLKFLDSGAVRLGSRSWFDERGRLRMAPGFALFRDRAERLLDEAVGLEFLRELTEFVNVFSPLYEGFRARAAAVEGLLRSANTRFVLVVGPRSDRISEAAFFVRRLLQAGLTVEGVVVNRLRPRVPPPCRGAAEGWRLLHWMGERDARGAAALEGLVGDSLPVVRIADRALAAADLAGLRTLGREVVGGLAGGACRDAARNP
jgi:anion-transporting  ArsA/GET3 family ATPase